MTWSDRIQWARESGCFTADDKASACTVVGEYHPSIPNYCLESEAQASLQAYESLWKGRADLLGAVSLALAGTADVRGIGGYGRMLTIDS